MALYTLEQYLELKEAYAQGVTSVGHGNKRVQYRSRAEMRAILDEMENELGLETRKRARVSRTAFTRSR